MVLLDHIIWGTKEEEEEEWMRMAAFKSLHQARTRAMVMASPR